MVLTAVFIEAEGRIEEDGVEVAVVEKDAVEDITEGVVEDLEEAELGRYKRSLGMSLDVSERYERKERRNKHIKKDLNNRSK